MIESLIRKTSDSNAPRQTLGLFVLMSLGLQGLLLVGGLWLFGFVVVLAHQPAPSLVQLSTGEAIEVAPLGSKQRTPEVIRTFVRDTFSTMFTWTGYLPGQAQSKPQLDTGMVVTEAPTQVTRDADSGELLPQTVETSNSNRKVTTAAWESSLTLSADFRQPFLAKLAQITPQSVFSGDLDVVFVPLDIREPEALGDGKWKVIAIANLMVFRGSTVETVIPFQKEVFVQAVEAPKYQGLPETKPSKEQGKETEEITPIAQVIAKIRASGLEIYAIRDYQRENL